MRPIASHLHQLPPDEFVWGLIEVPVALGSRRPSQQQLEYLLEPLVPVPIEQVHVVFHQLNDRRFVACGMIKDLLDEHVRSLNSQVTILTPSSLPAFIDAEVDPQRLNLLCGSFEPRPVARLRRFAVLQAGALVLICSLLIAMGLELRTRQVQQQVEIVREQRSAVFAQVLGPQAIQSRQPPELQLTAMLRQLRQTRSTDIQHELVDVSDSIALLLGQWPSLHDDGDSLHVQAEHISITPTVITVRSVLPGAGDAQRLAERLGQIEKWRLRQPQFVAAGESVQATLQFDPEGRP